MSKRAKYIGPFSEVVVQDSEAGINSPVWMVKRGGLLPADAPARVRDSLLANEEEWSEVNQADQKKGDTKDGDS